MWTPVEITKGCCTNEDLLKTFSKKDYFDAFKRPYLEETEGFALADKQEEEWCACTYYIPLMIGRNAKNDGVIAYEDCPNCFGYGFPSVHWKEVNK